MKLRIALLGMVALLGACGGPDRPDDKTPDDKTPDDKTPVLSEPGAPTQVKAEAVFNNVTVSWKAPASDGGSAITGYKVVSNPDGDVVELDADELEAFFPGLTPNRAYKFAVSALNAQGESEAVVSNEVITAVPPSPALNVVAVEGNATLTVTWDAPESGLVNGYLVTTVPATTPQTLDAEVRQAVFNGLQNGTTYRASVVARTEVGNSNPALSNEVTPFTVPSASAGVLATALGTSVDVEWIPAQPNGRPITHYLIRSSTGSELTVSGELTKQRIDDLVAGTDYSFSVSAQNEAGFGPSSTSNTVRTFTVPDAPTNVVASTGDRSASVNWTAPASNGGNAITGFVITTDPATTSIEVGNVTSAHVPNLTAGSRYTFSVQAKNGAGLGAAGTSSQVLIDENECVRNTHTCNASQFCTNTTGSFTCDYLLTNLTSSAGTLSFSPTTFDYTIPVSAFVSSVQLTPTLTQPVVLRANGTVTTATSLTLNVGETLTLEVSRNDLKLTYTLRLSQAGGLGYLKASDATQYNHLGEIVATDGNTVVVGVPQKNVLGMNNAGEVYVFTYANNVWTEQARITSPNRDMDDHFGISVDVSGDTLVIGATHEDGNTSSVMGTYNNLSQNAGAAYVYTRSGSTWSQQAYLKADNADPDDRFGVAVAIDGNTIAVGSGSEDGHLNNTSGSGAVYVFTRSNTTWTQQAMLKASNPSQNDDFGVSLDLSGDYLVVGAPKEQGDALSTAANPNNNIFQNPPGAAYVFVRSNNTWTQQAYLKIPEAAAYDMSGSAVAISGDTLAFSTHGAGKVQVYTRSGATWTRQSVLESPTRAAGDMFGFKLALAGDRLVTSAYYEKNDTILYAGAAHYFTRSGSTWSLASRLTSPLKRNQGMFGRGLALSSTLMAVGAPGDDGNASSTLETPNTNAESAGAVFTYRF